MDGLAVGDRDAVFWDRELSGFGVRVYPSGAKVYVVQTRALGKSKRVTLGRHGVISADQARRKAAMIIARIKAGEDLSPPSSVTVAKLTVADSGGTLSQGTRRGSLQAPDEGGLSLAGDEVRAAGIGQARDL